MISLSGLISVIVILLVLAVIAWGARYIVATVPIEPPLGKIIVVVVTVICCLYALVVLLQFIGVLTGVGPFVLRP